MNFLFIPTPTPTPTPTPAEPTYPTQAPPIYPAQFAADLTFWIDQQQVSAEAIDALAMAYDVPIPPEVVQLPTLPEPGLGGY
jgi:hypothetical protein